MNCQNCGAGIPANASQCPRCGSSIAQAPPPPGAAPGYPGQIVINVGGAPQGDTTGAVAGPHEPKSKIAAGLLGIFLGCFGVHRFYLGYTGIGAAQLCLTLLTCGWGGIITWIWGLIEGIMILTGSINKDAAGQPLKG
jgi:TM2 domain-containing membrane protein YozV